MKQTKHKAKERTEVNILKIKSSNLYPFYASFDKSTDNLRDIDVPKADKYSTYKKSYLRKKVRNPELRHFINL